MSSFKFSPENGQSGTEKVTLKDEAGRSLSCYVEHALEADGSTYLLLMPVESTATIIAWNDFEDSSEATWIEDDAEIDKIFEDAKAVLAEQNLTLKRTAYVLTFAGDVPPAEEDDILTLEIEEDNSLASEELQFLASFFHEDQEYAIYTPIEPLLFFAQRNQAGQLELLSPEEFQKIQPMLEEFLFNELD